MTSLKDFPGAPADAPITEEGWLVLADQAWTVDDWRSTPVSERPRTAGRRTRAYPTDQERRAARADAKRRWNEKRRADPEYLKRERDRERQRRAQREVAA